MLLRFEGIDMDETESLGLQLVLSFNPTKGSNGTIHTYHARRPFSTLTSYALNEQGNRICRDTVSLIPPTHESRNNFRFIAAMI